MPKEFLQPDYRKPAASLSDETELAGNSDRVEDRAILDELPENADRLLLSPRVHPRLSRRRRLRRRAHGRIRARRVRRKYVHPRQDREANRHEAERLLATPHGDLPDAPWAALASRDRQKHAQTPAGLRPTGRPEHCLNMTSLK